MISVVLGIGSNCGDRKANVEEAIAWLKTMLTQTSCSDIYETPCAGKEGTPYMNAVMKGIYQGIGYELEDLLKEKERQMGRNTQCRQKGEVPIDIDIVVCDNAVWKPWDFRQKFFSIGFSQIVASK